MRLRVCQWVVRIARSRVKDSRARVPFGEQVVKTLHVRVAICMLGHRVSDVVIAYAFCKNCLELMCER